jgi:multiple sugar transport system substrate-binding protein
MDEKARDLFDAFAAGRVGRRELIRRAAGLGIGAAAAGTFLNAAQSRALAADYDWKAHQGTALKLLLNKHPYADAMIADIENFKSLTGMSVTWDIFPEDVYFDKVTAALSSHSTEYDAFMTGAYQTWQYGPAGWLVDLNEYLKDPKKTAPNYDWEGMLEGLRASTAWSGKPGDALGGPGAKQWCVPWGFELNNVSYNQTIFDKVGVKMPKNLPEMLEVAAKITKDAGGPYGIGVRGSRSWATIHPGFLSGYTNYGGHDFMMQGGKLKAAMNSPQSKEFTKLWVQMIQQSGPKNWATYTWYQVGTDLGAGASGMIYDADILGYFMNSGDNKERGHLAYAPFAANPQASAPTANVWIWSLAMSNFSKKKDAAWDFIQWATGTDHLLYGARKQDMVNPVRTKVWDDPEFKEKISKYPGYLNEYTETAPKAKIYFTPQPLFFNLTTDWAAALQQMVAKQIPVDEGLDKLAENINRQLKSAGLG